MHARLTDDTASHKPSRSESARLAAQDYRESFGILPCFWTVPYQCSNGYFGCEDSYNNANKFESHCLPSLLEMHLRCSLSNIRYVVSISGKVNAGLSRAGWERLRLVQSECLY